MRLINYIFLLVFLLLSCENSSFDCTRTRGEIITKELSLPPFNAIDVNDNIDVEILNVQEQHIQLVEGSNIIEGIKFEVKDSVLFISSNNHCNWVRNYEHPLVKLNIANIKKITQHGYGYIYSNDTLAIENLSINCQDASGNVQLAIKGNKVDVVANTVSNVTLLGKVSRLSLGSYYNTGIIDTKNLQTGWCYVTHAGYNDMHINVTNELSGTIRSNGRVIYYGQIPSAINVKIEDIGTIEQGF